MLFRSRNPNVSLHQPTIHRQQQPQLVTFPKSNSVVINAEGAYVPRAVFGQNATLDYRFQAGSRGTEVVLYAPAIPVALVREPFEAEQVWLRANGCAYRGRWVALSGAQLLAVGATAAEVYRGAKDAGIRVPFVEYIPADDVLPFAGW